MRLNSTNQNYNLAFTSKNRLIDLYDTKLRANNAAALLAMAVLTPAVLTTGQAAINGAERINTELQRCSEGGRAIPELVQCASNNIREDLQKQIPVSAYKAIEPDAIKESIERIGQKRPDLAELAERTAFIDNSSIVGPKAGAHADETIQNGELVGFIRFKNSYESLSPQEFDSTATHELQHVQNVDNYFNKHGVLPQNRRSIQNEASAGIAECETSESYHCDLLKAQGIEGLKSSLREKDLYKNDPEYSIINPKIDPTVSLARIYQGSNGKQTLIAETSDGFTYSHPLQNSVSSATTGFTIRPDLRPEYKETCPVQGPTPDCWEVKPPDGSTVRIFNDINRRINIQRPGQAAVFEPEGEG